MSEREPIKTLDALNKLSSDEVVEGYFDGLNNEPCGGNRSVDYWHGWRNGMVDGKHVEIDDAQRILVHEYAKSQKATP